VQTENERNEQRITSLKEKKDKAYSKEERARIADDIAKVMREKTTRSRRLRDRERVLIQETIIENVMDLVTT